MTLDEIRELIGLVTETGVAELEVQRGDNRVRIRRVAGNTVQEIALPAVSAPSTGPVPGPAASAAAETGAAAAAAPGPDPTLHLVKSPIVGTFYEASAPSAPPFVRIGERVQPGKVLCIIESMKLMNEIEAEVAGILEAKYVGNGQPVEYGEALFAIRAV